MKNLFVKFKSVIFLLIASLFFGQALSYANVAGATGEQFSVQTHVRNETVVTPFMTEVGAENGQKITYRAAIKNLSDTENLTGASVEVQLPAGLSYVPGTTYYEEDFHVFVDQPDGITDGGLDIPELAVHDVIYYYFTAKVESGASGTLSPVTIVSMDDQSITNSNADINVGGNNTPLDPKMVVDTKAVNLGTNPHPGEYPDRDWADSVNVAVGETIGVYVLTFNDQPLNANSILTSVVTKASVTDTAGGFRITGNSDATNSTAKNDSLNVRTGAAKLNYVAGSARLYFFDTTGSFVSAPLGDSVMTSGINVGDLKAGGQPQGRYVYFQMRASSSNATGTIQLEKHVYKNGGWLDEGSQDPDKQVDFVVKFPNGSTETVRTNTYGSAELTDVPFGAYEIHEIVPTGFEQVEEGPNNFVLDEGHPVQKFIAQNKQVVVVTPTPTPSVTPTPTPTPSVTPTPTPSITPTPSVTPTPTPSPKVPALQIAKYVGNANKNEATDKTETKAVAGDVLNWRVVIKNVGDEMIRNLRTNDVLPANVRVTTDFVITRDGNRFKLIDFTRQPATIGDLAPGQEVTIEFGTAISRDVACGNELVNTAYAEADNHGKIRSEAKAKSECVTVAGKQQPLVKTGSSELALSMILSMLSVAGYYYQRQRKQVSKLFHSF